MKQKWSNIRYWKEIAFGAFMLALMFGLILYIKEILSGMRTLMMISKPILYGFVIAFILNVPMSAAERFMEKRSDRIKLFKREKFRKNASLIGTLLLFLVLIIIFVSNIIPNLLGSISTFTGNIQTEISAARAWIEELSDRYTIVEDLLGGVQWSDMLNELASRMGTMMNGMVTVFPQLGSSLVSFGISLVIAVYALIDKNRLLRQAKSLVVGLLPKEGSRKIIGFSRLFAKTYHDFFTGQCLESVILGCFLFVVLMLLGIPYAGIIAMMAAFFQFIPYVGSFLAWLIGGALVLLATPEKVILYLIMFQVVQFIEGQFIYPRIVGGSVGLPAIYTLMAVFLGGELFGVLGMLFFIPLTSVIYQLVGDYVKKKAEVNAQE